MLSQLSTEELHMLYPNEQIDGLTDLSLTSRTALERDLESTRRRGYALSMQESEEGVTSVAVPVASPSGTRYAISASVPVHRMTLTLRDSIVAVLTEAAQELATLLI
jgi:DNA-binding IclR family transcriptional regulator